MTDQVVDIIMKGSKRLGVFRMTVTDGTETELLAQTAPETSSFGEIYKGSTITHICASSAGRRIVTAYIQDVDGAISLPLPTIGMSTKEGVNIPPMLPTPYTVKDGDKIMVETEA